MFLTAVSIFVISNHNSFRVLFDKTTFVYFIWKNIYIYILALEMASPGIQHCAIVSAHFCSLYRHLRFFCDLAYAWTNTYFLLMSVLVLNAARRHAPTADVTALCVG